MVIELTSLNSVIDRLGSWLLTGLNMVELTSLNIVELTSLNIVELTSLNSVELSSLNMVVDRLEQTVHGLMNEQT